VSILVSGRLANMLACASCPAREATGALYQLIPDTVRDETAGDVVVLRVYGPSQSRDGI
jgi:hypothetical protein